MKKCKKKLKKEEILLILEKFDIDTNVLNELLEHYERCNGGYAKGKDIVLTSESILPFNGFIAFNHGDLAIEIYLDDLKLFDLNLSNYDYLPFALCTGIGVYCLDLKTGEVVLFMEEDNRFWNTAWKSFSSFKESLYNEEALSSLNENSKNLLRNKISLLVQPKIED